ncbi:ribonuclease H [Trifolium pratense]|uniref:Ribonuclease H n=1 Tax=Trifolium pratense TaxID=57577 RepID=A0A2K3PKZ1_TRIPR|nr:ribonuclease H [Trifolium pratense]
MLVRFGEINIQRGLKPGDPLAPFLFLLVAEGLGGLMKKAVEQNRFRGFELGRNEICVSHLQYAYDTLCIGEASIENLWTLKAILRANPRRASTWEPLVESLHSVLVYGEIIFVWKKVRRIHREFLWGYKGGRKRISWVKWDTVCKPKNLGGLGVRDIRAVNIISLLAKWWWRLLEDDNALWKEVLKNKYGETVTGTINMGGGSSDKENRMRGSNEILARYLGRYSLSAGKVSASLFGFDSKGLYCCGITRYGGGSFKLEFSEDCDKWGWVYNDGGDFTVKSTYWSIINLFVPMEPLGLIESKTFASLWKGLAPSKVIAFAWQLLLDRIPARQNLIRRQITLPVGGQFCVWCGSAPESVMHLFIYCDFARKICTEVFIWLGLDFSLPHNLFSILNKLQGSALKKLMKKGLTMNWTTVVWAIWKMRNAVIFDNGVAEAAKVVDEVKFWSWKWWLGRGEVVGMLPPLRMDSRTFDLP